MSIRLLFIVLMISSVMEAQNGHIQIAFNDLPRLLEQSSSQVKIINANLELAGAKHDAALQWSNPDLNYVLEQVDNNSEELSEHMVYFSKDFALPWNYWQEEDVWQAKIKAASMVQQQKMKHLLAETRGGYTRLYLLQNLSDQLSALKQMLDDLNKTVQTRQEEGALSQLKANLLSMSIFVLDADILRVQQKYLLALNKWKQTIGIDSLSEVKLTTLIEYKQIPTDVSQLSQKLDKNPGMQAQQNQLIALEKNVGLEKGRVLPSINLQGGYKKINQDWEGYTVGFSLPLPVLNWNGPQIEEQEIKHRIQIEKTAIYKQTLRNDIDNLIFIVENSSVLLHKNNSGMQNFQIAEDLIAVYRDGGFSLVEFLNAFQLYYHGSRQYTEQLIAYYDAVFELEALVDKQLVTF